MERAIAIGIVSVLVLVGGTAGSARADEVAQADAVLEADPVDELDRWGVNVSAGFDVLMLGASATIDTNFVTGTIQNPGVRFDPDAEGSEFFVNPMFGGGVQLSTPVVLEMPGRPRLYVGGNLRYAQKIPHAVASAGDKPKESLPEEKDYFTPGVFQVEINGRRRFLPIYPSSLGGETVDPRCDSTCAEEFIAGQGTAVRAEFQHFFWEAELGLMFTVPLEQRRLFIRPAIAYYETKMSLSGQAHRVYRDRGDQSLDPPEFGPFTNAELDGDAELTVRSLGPKLVIELEAERFSQLGQSFGASIFLDGGIYWALGNRSVDWGASQAVPGTYRPAQDLVQEANYHFEVDELSYKLGVGFRLNWYPR